MTDDAPAPAPPEPGADAREPGFGGFRIEPEALPDGRTIRYYAWPEAPAGEPAGDEDQAE